jgi:hypothetical protein
MKAAGDSGFFILSICQTCDTCRVFLLTWNDQIYVVSQSLRHLAEDCETDLKRDFEYLTEY